MLLLLYFAGFFISSQGLNVEVPRKIYKALNSTLNFVYENRNDMNVDALFGVVFAKGA